MYYELSKLSNGTSAGQKEVGNTRKFYFDGKVFYFNNIRSSKVKTIKVKDGEMVVQTKNSKYTFKEV